MGIRLTRWSLVVFGLFSIPVIGAPLDFQPMTMSQEGIEQIHLKGFHGFVTFVHHAAHQVQIKVRQTPASAPSPAMRRAMEEWNFSVQRVGTTLELSVSMPAQRDLLVEALDPRAAPRYDIEVRAQSRPLVVSWRTGTVKVVDWEKSVELASQEGTLEVKGGQGDVRLASHKATLLIVDREGSLVSRNFEGATSVQNHKGSVTVEGFSGEISLAKVDGAVQVETFQSRMQLADITGRLEFDSVSGPFRATGVRGSVRGQSQQGAVQAQVMGPSDIRIQSREGSVTLELVDSGAALNLGSESGWIQVPPSIRVESAKQMRMARGRLRGSAEGQVFVRTTSGGIRVR